MSKVDKNLIVEIPKKYRVQLTSRFSPSNLRNGVIEVECPLCKDFRKDCRVCPFGKYKNVYLVNLGYTRHLTGSRCINWISQISFGKVCIFWFYKASITVRCTTIKSSVAKKVLKEFKERALKHIVWV